MKKFLLSLILILSSIVPSMAQSRSFGQIDKSTFSIHYIDAKSGPRVGTAFCIPGQLGMIMTAEHTLGSGYWVEDSLGKKVKVRAQVVKGTDHKDIAVLMLEDPACQFSTNEWALKNEAPSSRPMTLFGYGLGKKVMTVGTIAGPAGDVDEFVINGQFANLNAVGGHSGGPVYNPEGKIVGMLVGSANSIDVIDVIIPVETLKRWDKK